MGRTLIIASMVLSVLLCSPASRAQKASNTQFENKTQTLKNSAQALRKQLESELAPQRKVYQRAIKALERGRRTEYKQLVKKLKDYPLYPNLQYSQLSKRLHRATNKEVDAFLNVNGESQLGQRLRYRWLRHLAKRQRWTSFLKFYNEDTQSTELQCHWLSATIKTRRSLPKQKIAALWNVGRSQPKACDFAFKTWVKSGNLTPKLAWERHAKSIKNRKLSLARYIAKSMPAADQRLSKLYLEVDAHPTRLSNMQKFRTRKASERKKMNEVILHGFTRYARSNSLQAHKIWQRYDSKNLFDQQPRQEMLYILARRLSQKGHHKQATQLLAQYKTIDNSHLLESLIRESLGRQDWNKVLFWIAKLPKDNQNTERWQYWLARSLEQTGLDKKPEPALKPDSIYRKLAMERSFYGFLSADRLQLDYQLQDIPLSVAHDDKLKLVELAGVRRSYEFYRLGDKINANREWYYLANRLDKHDLKTLAALTHDWDWHIKTIQGMASIKYWNDLQMRFPLAYEDELRKAAKATKIKQTLLYAIARQESAFAADARSPAGAMGLMQLMPSTAKQTARSIGMKYRREDLYKPKSNITLGSNYLNQLLKRFNGNRIFAAAAYNAGPYRVSRWLKKSPKSLPIDSWIETIPFKETRGYVQNVLSYSVIYAYRMGDKHSLLTEEEIKSKF